MVAQTIQPTSKVVTPDYYALANQELINIELDRLGTEMYLAVLKEDLENALGNIDCYSDEIIREVKEENGQLLLLADSWVDHTDTLILVSLSDDKALNFAPNKEIKFSSENAIFFVGLGKCYESIVDNGNFAEHCKKALQAIDAIKEFKNSIQQTQTNLEGSSEKAA